MVDQSIKKKEPEGTKKEQPGQCSCVADPFAALPPELRPQKDPNKAGLRKALCPGCETEYWTNRKIDLCIACEKQRRSA